eukprot:3122577-Pleurochrysis_carterae.AAC.1
MELACDELVEKTSAKFCGAKLVGMASGQLSTLGAGSTTFAENVASAAVVKILRQVPLRGQSLPSAVPKKRVASGVGLSVLRASTACITESADWKRRKAAKNQPLDRTHTML